MNQLKPEIWKDIKGFDGKYQISSFGRVKNAHGIMKLHLKRGGYLGVNLRRNKKQYGFTVHKLVALHFPVNGKGDVVNHIDENRLNNMPSNLEWTSQRANILHSYYKHNTRKPVFQYDNSYNLIQKWESIAKASKETGLARQNISKCINDKRKTSGGFIWK